MISKRVEGIMLDRIEMYINTNHNQFVCKRKHGTDQCIFVLKETCIEDLMAVYLKETCIEDLMAVYLYVSWMLVRHLKG